MLTRSKRRKTKKGRPSRVGAPRARDTIRAFSTARDYDIVRFHFSEDIVDKLFELYDLDYALINPTYGFERHKQHRLQFVRCADMGLPLVLVRVEPPSFDPRGQRMWRPENGHQYITAIKARRIGVTDGLMNKKLEHYWADLPGRNQLRGLIIVFPDDDMLLTPEARARAGKSRASGLFDLIA